MCKKHFSRCLTVSSTCLASRLNLAKVLLGVFSSNRETFSWNLFVIFFHERLASYIFISNLFWLSCWEYTKYIIFHKLRLFCHPIYSNTWWIFGHFVNVSLSEFIFTIWQTFFNIEWPLPWTDRFHIRIFDGVMLNNVNGYFIIAKIQELRKRWVLECRNYHWHNSWLKHL